MRRSIAPEPVTSSTVVAVRMPFRRMLEEALFCVAERMRRTIFAIVGIAVGIAAVVCTVGVASSAGASLLVALDSREARTIEARATTDVGGQGIPAGAVAAVAALPGVESAGALTRGAETLVRTLPPWQDVLGGTSLPTYLATPGLVDACGCSVVSGRWFTSADLDGDARPVVLGARAAGALGIDRVGAGRALYLDDDTFQVVGIVQGTPSSQFADGVILPVDPAVLTDPTALVVLAEQGWGQAVRTAVATLLDPNRTGTVTVSASVDYDSVQQRIAGDIDGLYLALGGISMLVGAIGIANTRLMAVYERAAEIGLRRALGATTRGIAGQFALESAILGLIGGVLGASVGLVSVVMIAAAQGWPPVVSPALPLAGPVAGLALGVLAGLYPALRAARVEPVSALRGG